MSYRTVFGNIVAVLGGLIIMYGMWTYQQHAPTDIWRGFLLPALVFITLLLVWSDLTFKWFPKEKKEKENSNG